MGLKTAELRENTHVHMSTGWRGPVGFLSRLRVPLSSMHHLGFPPTPSHQAHELHR